MKTSLIHLLSIVCFVVCFNFQNSLSDLSFSKLSIRSSIETNPTFSLPFRTQFTENEIFALDQNPVQGTWATQANSYRGQNGKRITFTFPGGGSTSGRLWGTDLYTDDSSIALAAVHAGLISPQNGGTVTIEIRAGAQSYNGSARNGVTSTNYGAYSGSFVFVSNSVSISTPIQVAVQGTWATLADTYRGQNGKRITFTFPGGGSTSGRLWGTDLYTDDSSIALAAVHAGLISPQSGGTVTIEIRAGAQNYPGSTRNGVSSTNYGAFSGSFVFVSNSVSISSPVQVAVQGTWATQADTYRGQIGKRVTFTFPGGGSTSGRLWGTDLYTDDSSIALAAVHAGLISPQNGGTVTIEIRDGAQSYTGSARNGVTSTSYGTYSGSFVFVSNSTSISSSVLVAVQGTWATQANTYRGQNGKRITFTFPGGGSTSGRLWGTDFYTDDSSIALAAVHAGLISPQNGGTVTIEIRAGATSYSGTTRNGVTSTNYGSYSGSFVFVR